jgi:hypothetical protein
LRRQIYYELVSDDGGGSDIVCRYFIQTIHTLRTTALRGIHFVAFYLNEYIIFPKIKLS